MAKKIAVTVVLALTICFGFLFYVRGLQAAPDDRINQGVSVAGIDLSGMTEQEATAAIESYVDTLGQVVITLQAESGNVEVTAGEMGLTWTNRDLAREAVLLGRSGNIVARYKAMEDLAHRGKQYEIVLDFDKEAIRNLIQEHAGQFDTEAVDAKLSRVNGAFVVEEGQTGYIVDTEASTEAVYQYLTREWRHGEDSVALSMRVEEPKGTKEELLLVKDVLGSFTTSYSSSGPARSENVANGCRLIDGITLYPGEAFSTYDAVKPFSEENGYRLAGSYLNGQVVDSIGGGICQVSTTLYNAVLQAELEVTERHNHSMIVNYVDPSADAAIAESAGKDFRFVNNLEHPIYIEGYTADKQITFCIYGVESRQQGRSIRYESKVLETLRPEGDRIVEDASQPVGYIHVSSEHIGYKAELWKVVSENGVEVSREKVNGSSYQMSPRTATVGTATGDPAISERMSAAIASASIDQVKSTIADIQAAQSAPDVGQAQPTPEQLAQILAAQQAAQAAAGQ